MHIKTKLIDRVYSSGEVGQACSKFMDTVLNLMFYCKVAMFSKDS